MQVSSVIKTSCCASCANKLEGDSFSQHLTNCLRNLEGEFDHVRRHRDALEVELEELRRLESERGQVADSVERLSNELSQLRLENREMRSREERVNSEQKRNFVPRTEFEKLLNEHKNLMLDLQDQECKDKQFGELSVRAAKHESRVGKLEEELSSVMTSKDKFEKVNKHLETQLEETKEKLYGLQNKCSLLESELGPMREVHSSSSKLKSQFDEVSKQNETNLQKISDISGKNSSQHSLIEYLTAQLGEKSHALIEADRTHQRNAQLEAMLDAARAEMLDLENILKNKMDQVESLQSQQYELKEQAQNMKLQIEGDKMRMSNSDSTFEREMGSLQSLVSELKTELTEAKTSAEKAIKEKDTFINSNKSMTTDYEDMKHKLTDLEEQVVTLRKEREDYRSDSGKSAKELERLIAALKKELGVEQMANKRLCDELTDSTADKDTAIAVYKKLQSRYGLVKKEWEKLREENNDLKRDGSEIGKLREDARALERKLLSSEGTVAQLKTELDTTKSLLQQAQHEVQGMKHEHSNSAEGLIGETRRLRQENNALRADLAQVMSSFDKLKLLAEHYKAKLAEYDDATSSNHTCAKGKRCPCKTRPPPPSRWKS